MFPSKTTRETHVFIETTRETHVFIKNHQGNPLFPMHLGKLLRFCPRLIRVALAGCPELWWKDSSGANGHLVGATDQNPGVDVSHNQHPGR